MKIKNYLMFKEKRKKEYNIWRTSLAFVDLYISIRQKRTTSR